MPSNTRDLPCASCGTMMWRTPKSLPEGRATCQPCRRAVATSEEIRARNREYARRCRQKKRSTATGGKRVETAVCGCGQVFSRTSRSHRKCGACAEAIRGICVDCGEGFVKSRGKYRALDRCVTCNRSVAARKRIAVLTERGVYGNPKTPSGGDYRERAKRYGVRYEPVSRLKVYERDGWRCGICSEPIDRDLEHPDPRSVSLDHIVPLSLGGPHIAGNCQPAHLRCNIMKSNKVEHAATTA